MKTSHRIIGIDLDDTLLNFNGPFLVFYNLKYGTSYRREDMTVFNLESVFGLTFEEMHTTLHEFFHSDDHKNADPIVGAVDAITMLAKNNTLYIVTASPLEYKQKLVTWVGKHFPGAIKDIHFTRKDLFDRNAKKKADVCKELGIEVFIDDSLENAKSISESAIPVFLLNAPWNQGEVNSPLISRVHSWEEILKQI